MMSNLPSSYFVKQSLLVLNILLLRIYLLPFVLSFINFKIFFQRMASMVSYLLEGLSTKLILSQGQVFLIDPPIGQTQLRLRR